MKPKRTIKIPLRRTAAVSRGKPKISARAASVEESEIEDYEMEAEPNMRFSHALFVVLLLHVIAVVAVFAFNSIKSRQAATPPVKTAGMSSAPPATAGSGVSTPAAPAKPTPAAPRTHTVAAGDTLGKIATRYRTSVGALETANSLSSNAIIRVGQTLIIPGPGAPQPPSVSPKKPALATVVASVKPPATPAPRPVAASAATPVPAATGGTRDTGEPAVPTEPAPGAAGLLTNGVYVVAKGDNPYSIAKKLGVSYQKLLEVNHIEDPTKMQIGQKLKVPPAN